MAVVPDLGSGFIDNSLPYLLTLAAVAASSDLNQKLKNEGVNVPVWRVLSVLLDHPGEPVSDLAKRCLLQQPTMSKLLDRLTKDRLIVRRIDDQDRRIARVSLTTEGKALATGLVRTAKQHEAALLARFPHADAMKDGLRVLAIANLGAGAVS